MRVRRMAWLAALGLALAASPKARAAEKTWAEVRSPHFRVLTDGSEGDARRVAREFEQMRTVFAIALPKMRLDSGAPLLVLAPRDEDSMKALLPVLWKRKGFKPAGVFQHGWERQYAVVRLDQIAPDAYEVVYHEYVHSLLHLNFRWLPVWLDEGFAELYGNTRFEQKRMLVGAPSWRLGVIQAHPLIPLDTLLAVNQASPYYHDESKAEMFYAQSWALTHFLVFGPGMEDGKRFNRFFRQVQLGEEQGKAFHEVFGDSAALEKALGEYVRKFSMTVWVVPSPAQINEKDFAARRLTAAETEAELGTYHLWNRDLELARGALEAAARDDAKLGLAREGLGFLAFGEGKDEEASRDFAQAYELDSKLYLAQFYHLMLSGAARSEAAGDESGLESGLLQTLSLDPEFAPAYVELARLYVRQGELERALAQSRKAEQLEPTRAGYALLSGRILLRMGRGKEAAQSAQYVAERWTGTDHDEAVELWNSIPAEQRPAGEAPHESLPPGIPRAEGKVAAVTCGKDEGVVLTLAGEGQLLRFHAQGPFAAGFSDTIWYGADHFSLCHHLEGLRAVVRYRPSKDTSYAGEIVEVGVREDLPPAAAPKTAAKQ